MAGLMSPIRHSDPAEVLSYDPTAFPPGRLATRAEVRIASVWPCVKTVEYVGGSNQPMLRLRANRVTAVKSVKAEISRIVHAACMSPYKQEIAKSSPPP
jgi:hypothetical protein